MNQADKNIFNRYSKFLLIAFCLILVSSIGVLRYLTGPELALSLFYLFPIGLTSWYVGRWSGVLISFASAVSWLIADLMMLNSFSKSVIPYVNESFRLIVFLIVTCTLSGLKTSLKNHRQLARTDHLTGISNRRAFFDLANMELHKARRYQTPLSILYLDIDNFKHINDYYGHQVGDQLLRLVAKTIKNHVRAIDVTARFGGDEFGILLAETASGPASMVARKLKEQLLELMQHHGWPVTFSTGIVSFEIIPASVDEMLKAVDAQMYLAKKQGKNRIRHKTVDHRKTVPAMVNS
jgi:diguanylate cyclase (GGDEF)-like protein